MLDLLTESWDCYVLYQILLERLPAAAHVDPDLPAWLIQRSTDLPDGAWAPAGQKEREEGTNEWWDNGPPTNPVFYRLVATNTP